MSESFRSSAELMPVERRAELRQLKISVLVASAIGVLGAAALFAAVFIHHGLFREVAALKAVRAELGPQVDDIKRVAAQLEVLRGQRTVLDKELAELQDRSGSLGAQVARLEAAQQKSGAVVADLNKRIETLQAELDAREERIRVAGQRERAADNTRIEAEKKAKQSTDAAAAAEAARRDMAIQLQAAEQALGAVRVEIAGNDARKTQLQNQVKDLEDLQRRLQNVEAKLPQRERDAAAAEQRFKEVSDKLSRTTAELSTLSGSRDALTQIVADLKAQEKQLQNISKELPEKQNSLREVDRDLSAKRDAVGKVAAQLSTLTANRDASQNELAELAGRRNSLDDQLVGRRKAVDEITQALTKEKQNRETLRDEIGSLSQERDKAQRDLGAAKQTYADVEVKRQEAVSMVTDLEPRKKEHEELLAKLSRTAAGLDQKRAELINVSAELERKQDLVRKITIDTAAVEQLRVTIDALKIERSGLDQQIDDHKRALQNVIPEPPPGGTTTPDKR